MRAHIARVLALESVRGDGENYGFGALISRPSTDRNICRLHPHTSMPLFAALGACPTYPYDDVTTRTMPPLASSVRKAVRMMATPCRPFAGVTSSTPRLARAKYMQLSECYP